MGGAAAVEDEGPDAAADEERGCLDAAAAERALDLRGAGLSST